MARASSTNRAGPAGAVLAGIGLEHGILETRTHQIVLERAFVLEILLGFAARHLVERRLRNEEVAAIDDVGHLAIKEGEQERADMRAVHIRIGHDDDLVVAQFLDVELVASDAGAECGDERADLFGRQHLVETHALDVEDLAA